MYYLTLLQLINTHKHTDRMHNKPYQNTHSDKHNNKKIK